MNAQSKELAPATEALPVDPTLLMIERLVLDPNADITKLEKMMEMKERLEERQAVRAFEQAVATAKSKIGPIVKDGEVDYTNTRGDRTYFKHETLDGIARLIDPVLAEHGLSYRFRSNQNEGRLFVTCVLAHVDGHREETTLEGAPDTSGSKNSYQAVGSAATYLQRYTLKLALGLSATKDTDSIGPKAPPISEEKYRELQDMIERIGMDGLEKTVCDAARISMLPDLPADKFDSVRAKLQKTAEARGVKL